MLSIRERTGKFCVPQCRLQLSDDVPSVMPLNAHKLIDVYNDCHLDMAAVQDCL